MKRLNREFFRINQIAAYTHQDENNPNDIQPFLPFKHPCKDNVRIELLNEFVIHLTYSDNGMKYGV